MQFARFAVTRALLAMFTLILVSLIVFSLMELVPGTGLSAVIATHNLDLAARMDRQLRLDDGALVTL